MYTFAAYILKNNFLGSRTNIYILDIVEIG